MQRSLQKAELHRRIHKCGTLFDINVLGLPAGPAFTSFLFPLLSNAVLCVSC